jgi:hypothetical protein
MRLRSLFGATLASLGLRRYPAIAVFTRHEPWWRRVRHVLGPEPPSPPIAYTGPPPWVQPPESELGVAVPVREALASDAEIVIGLIDCVAYSTGLEFSIAVRSKKDLDSADLGLEPPPPYGDELTLCRTQPLDTTLAKLRITRPTLGIVFMGLKEGRLAGKPATGSTGRRDDAGLAASKSSGASVRLMPQEFERLVTALASDRRQANSGCPATQGLRLEALDAKIARAQADLRWQAFVRDPVGGDSRPT